MNEIQLHEINIETQNETCNVHLNGTYVMHLLTGMRLKIFISIIIVWNRQLSMKGG